ncbi:hypothetical protein BJF79_14770 [Actinomadura sp. CNU-125]|uniref:hypothetical protein n=1 Tax=Actinomadura sp. CNU-125 TaxID=1904961 RepID=UPI0009639EAE|nr:hypothetical protein [Actinomadura sp. CNU-125]OLT22708.1 hypothetical protein BJF79_14770 [Actinomadura sp. CNU-125]
MDAWSGEYLYSWDVRGPDVPGTGPVGISRDRRRAMEDLARALRSAGPGARGAVWAVRVDLARQAAYRYGGLVAEGAHDPASGEVTVEGPWPLDPVILGPSGDAGE